MQNSKLNLIAGSLFVLAGLCAGPQAMAQTMITQASVMAGGGFPLALNTTGSYRLGSNLQVPAGVAGVEITATGVTLDLNGFTISGVVACTEDTYSVSCTYAGENDVGIRSRVGNAVVLNGSVRGFNIGVYLYKGDHLERLHASHNHTGVRSFAGNGARTLIRDVRAELNREHGFEISDALVHASTAARNGSHGFKINRTALHESASYFNKGMGIYGGVHAAVSRTDTFANLLEEIHVATVKSMGNNRNGDVAY